GHAHYRESTQVRYHTERALQWQPYRPCEPACFENATRASTHWPSRGSPVAKMHRSRAALNCDAKTLALSSFCPSPSPADASGNLASSGPVQESAWISNSPAALALGRTTAPGASSAKRHATRPTVKVTCSMPCSGAPRHSQHMSPGFIL